MGAAVRNPVFARLYTRVSARESAELVAYRRELLAGLAGRVVEIGAGNGRNLGLYPAAVREVVAVEPEPYLREQARAAAARAPVPVTVVDAVAEALPFDDGSFDAAVACLVLCTVPDVPRALAEVHRVLAPGGELRFYEHVHAEAGPLRVALQLAERSGIWPRLLGGCHPTRDAVAAIADAGFAVTELRAFPFATTRIQPGIPHVLGRARRG